MIVPENQLIPLDPLGTSFQGKVPAYVATQILKRYGPDIAQTGKDSLSHWFLTSETTTPQKLNTWIGDRDFFESVYLLPPGSHLWLDAQSHLLLYVQAQPFPDPDWPENSLEMWMLKRVRVTTEDGQEVHAIWVTRYLIVEGNSASHSSPPIVPLFQPLQWYKDLARKRYQEEARGLDGDLRRQQIQTIARELLPKPNDIEDCLELLVVHPWFMRVLLPIEAFNGKTQITIVDLILQHLYQTLVTFLEEEQG